MEEKNQRIGIPQNKEFEWRSKNGTKPVSQMDDDHLQKALITSQKSELYYFNLSNFFSKSSDALLEEAERRGLKLLELDEVKMMGKFFANKRRLKVK